MTLVASFAFVAAVVPIEEWAVSLLLPPPPVQYGAVVVAVVSAGAGLGAIGAAIRNFVILVDFGASLVKFNSLLVRHLPIVLCRCRC